MRLPIGAVVSLQIAGDEKSPDYVSTVLGEGRWGLRVTMPRILDQEYVIPAGTQLVGYVVHERQLWEFKTHVMGYERTSPPVMIISEPQDPKIGNRRRALRLPVRLPVTYVTEGRTVRGEDTYTCDLSIEGLRMITTWVWPRGTNLVLRLDLPTEPLALTGGVMWSSYQMGLRQIHTGVQFSKMSESNQAVLAQFLRELERELAKPKLQ
jgi:c-di-GMP-binding flagellar brake protein YcgR